VGSLNKDFLRERRGGENLTCTDDGQKRTLKAKYLTSRPNPWERLMLRLRLRAYAVSLHRFGLIFIE